MCKSEADIETFANHCVFMWSVYLHGHILYEASSADDKGRMESAAPIFFGDLHQMLVEYTVLQVCKITDPAHDIRRNDNHTIEFLLKHYGLDGDAKVGKRLTELEAAIKDFRGKLLPARNKLISHSDRDAIIAGRPLGAAPQSDWNDFWNNLSELIDLIYQAVLGKSFVLKDVGTPSDADCLLKVLAAAEHFQELLSDKDRAVARRAAELAFR